MRTKFSEFDKESKRRYKKIRNFIIEFVKDKDRDPFSQLIKRDYSEEVISILEKKLDDIFDITLDDFFQQYKDKIYNDGKFTSCCGIIDVILYHYDKSYLLGGNKMSAGNRYKYGFHEYSLGITYIKQHFGSLDNFYDKVVESKIKEVCPGAPTHIEHIDDVICIFVDYDDVKELYKYLKTGEYIDMMEMNLLVILVGERNYRDELIENGLPEDEDMWNRIELFSSTKKFKL